MALKWQHDRVAELAVRGQRALRRLHVVARQERTDLAQELIERRLLADRHREVEHRRDVKLVLLVQLRFADLPSLTTASTLGVVPLHITRRELDVGRMARQDVGKIAQTIE